MIIDPKSDTPVFRQIADQVRDAIDVGVYRAGEALPSLRAMAVEIRVNPNTVQRAYDLLDREGVIESRRGIGVFVVDRQKQSPRGSAEKQLLLEFKQSAARALNEQLTPSRIRELFEVALDSSIHKARNRR